MNEKMWSDVDLYFASQLIPGDPALDAAVEASVAAQLPSIAVSPAQGKLLHVLARLCRAERILEIGTLGGYSTIWLARSLPPHGRLTTLEHNPRHAEVAGANVERAGLAGRVEIRVGKAIELLAAVEHDALGPFDLVFIDADKQGIPAYFEWALKLTRPGSLIIVDNVVRGGSVVDAASTDDTVVAVRRFMDMLSRESRVTATTIQTVGVKGWDGMTLALVN